MCLEGGARGRMGAWPPPQGAHTRPPSAGNYQEPPRSTRARLRTEMKWAGRKASGSKAGEQDWGQRRKVLGSVLLFS